jgi:hypothetical protein
VNVGKVVKDVVFGMASVGIAGLVVVCSTERYEWMIGEADTDGSRLTMCTIPTDPDSPRLMLSVAVLIPTLILTAFACHPARRRWRMAISLTVLGLWLYCFFVRFSGCPT